MKLGLLLFISFAFSFAMPDSASAEPIKTLNDLINFWNSNNVRSSQEAVDILPPNLKDHPAKLHFSKSPHPATAEYPRTIFFSQQGPWDKSSTFFLAVSFRPAAPPIVEAMDYNFDQRRVDYFALNWNSNGKLSPQKNPGSCFNCHGAGRAVWNGMSRDQYWPGAFSGGDYDRLNSVLEQTLSAFNTEIMADKILSHPQYTRFRDELIEVTAGENLNQEPFRFFWEERDDSLEDHIRKSHYLFTQLVSWPAPTPSFRFDTDHLEQTIKFTRLLNSMGLPRLIDDLGLNMRPDSYEISPTTYETLHKILITNPGGTMPANVTP